MKQFNFTQVVVLTIFFAITQMGIMREPEAHAGNASTGVIHACMAIKTGIVRIVPATGKCKKNESVLHWAIAGATGPVGPIGLPGLAGAPVLVHFIGENYGGGIVFAVDTEGQHGLIAATADQSPGIRWSNGNTETKAVRDGVNAGGYNTERIAINERGSYAAQLCAIYQGGGYADWYLPSKAELNLMYQQKGVIGGFTEIIYWSSSEADANTAWTQWFSDGFQAADVKSATLGVRAVRSF